MREENILLGSKFAPKFHKKYGVITYSGTLAIEIALCSLNLKKNSIILVSSEVCYSIINTILKLNFIPVIVIPKNQLYLTDEDILNVIGKQNIDCILLVHQYGILNNIDNKKYKDKGIKIIEDVAQAWDIESINYKVGEFSDIVVTSFGKTKPLSYGIGGGLFFNESSIFDKLDFYDNESRENPSILLSYTYPLCRNIDYDNLVNLADRIAKEQRNNALKYYELIKKQDIIKCIPYNNKIKNTWHRFPLWIDDYELYTKVVHELEKTDLAFQLPHNIKLIELERNTKCIKYCVSKNKKNFILLRTRDVNIDKQLMILNNVIKKCLIYNEK